MPPTSPALNAKNITHGSFAKEPADPESANGVALRYVSGGAATHNVNLTGIVDGVVVGGRSAPSAAGSVGVNVVVDEVAQAAQGIGSGKTGKTCALRSWPVTPSPRSHTIRTGGAGLAAVNGLLVDNVGPYNTRSPVSCDQHTPTTGDNTNPGTLDVPLATVDKLGGLAFHQKSDRAIVLRKGMLSSGLQYLRTWGKKRES